MALVARSIDFYDLRSTPYGVSLIISLECPAARNHKAVLFYPTVTGGIGHRFYHLVLKPMKLAYTGAYRRSACSTLWARRQTWLSTRFFA